MKFDHGVQITPGESEIISKDLSERMVFSGGGYANFHEAGENQLKVLLHCGLQSDSKLLDIGCGCLRGGRWAIKYLDPGCYFGIEPNAEMIKAGREIVIGTVLENEKSPSFDLNDSFDFSVFGTKFDYMVARSVWTHASKKQIERMLDQYDSFSAPGGILLASYLEPRVPLIDEYRGDGWVGVSHESDQSGVVRHSLKWIRKICKEKGMTVRRIEDTDLNFLSQVWLRVEKVSSN